MGLGRSARCKSASFCVPAQYVVHSALPARSRCAIGCYHVAIDSQADEFLSRAFLGTALAAISVNGGGRFLGQNVHQGPGPADFLGSPLGILGIRTTYILSHRPSLPVCLSAAG